MLRLYATIEGILRTTRDRSRTPWTGIPDLLARAMNISPRRAVDVLDALEHDQELARVEALPGRAVVYRIVRPQDELSRAREARLHFRSRAWSLELYDAFRRPPKVHRGRGVEPVVLRIVFAKLLEHANKDFAFDAWASQETIVKGCAGIARSTVLEALAVLRALGMQTPRPAGGRFPDYEQTRRQAPFGAVIRRVVVPTPTRAARGPEPLQQAGAQGMQLADQTPAAGGHKRVPGSQEPLERGTGGIVAQAADVVRSYAARAFPRDTPDRYVTRESIAAAVALLRDGHPAEHIAKIGLEGVASDPKWFDRDDELRTPRRVFGNRERFAVWALKFTPRSRELHKTPPASSPEISAEAKATLIAEGRAQTAAFLARLGRRAS